MVALRRQREGGWGERATPGPAWRGHLAAAVALLLLLGVAAIGASDREPTHVAASRAPDGGPVLPGEVVAGAAAPEDGVVSGRPGASGGRATSAAGGSGSAEVTGAGGGGRRAYPPGVSDSTIRIGGSTFTSGPAAVYGEQIAVGFAAGIAYVNDHGGINGRRVELVLYDDGADPAKQLANTKRLVEVDEVFALAMVYAPAVGDYVASKGIPVFHLGQFDEEFTNPWWFPVGGPQRGASYWMADFGVNRLDAKSVAVFYLDAGTANYSRAYAESVAGDWTAYGAEVPVLAPFAPDQTSCSDALSQAREAEVDFIQFEIDAAKVINCGVEAQLQGYKPPKGWGGYLIGVPVIYEALGDFAKGMYAFDAFGALYDVPDYARYVKKISSSTQARSSVTISYFVSALLMRDALEALGDDLTRQGVRDVLNTFSGWQPGLTSDTNQASWTWTPECHVGLRGGYVIQVQEGADGELRWVQITDQLRRTPIPPGTQPPARYASCDIFTHESVFGAGS